MCQDRRDASSIRALQRTTAKATQSHDRARSLHQCLREMASVGSSQLSSNAESDLSAHRMVKKAADRLAEASLRQDDQALCEYVKWPMRLKAKLESLLTMLAAIE